MNKKIDLNKFKEVVGQLKTKQKQLQGLMNKETLQEAKKYAEASKQELQKLLKTTDVKKVKSLIAKEAAEIKKLQTSIPVELARFTKYVEGQKKEFEKILKNVSALEAADFIQKKVSDQVRKGKTLKSTVTSKKKTTRKPTVVKADAAKSAQPVEATIVTETQTQDSASNQS
jgi:hypothetical protein